MLCIPTLVQKQIASKLIKPGGTYLFPSPFLHQTSNIMTLGLWQNDHQILSGGPHQQPAGVVFVPELLKPNDCKELTVTHVFTVKLRPHLPVNSMSERKHRLCSHIASHGERAIAMPGPPTVIGTGSLQPNFLNKAHLNSWLWPAPESQFWS